MKLKAKKSPPKQPSPLQKKRANIKTLKRANKTLGLGTLLLATTAIAAALVISEPEATTELYLQTNKPTVAAGEMITVDVRLNASSEAVNALHSNLTYSTDQLELDAIDTSNSAFAIEAENSSKMGYITIARGNIKGVSGDVLVGTLTFKTLGEAHSNGAPEISFTDGTMVLSETNNRDILQSTKATLITIRTNQ